MVVMVVIELILCAIPYKEEYFSVIGFLCECRDQFGQNRLLVVLVIGWVILIDIHRIGKFIHGGLN